MEANSVAMTPYSKEALFNALMVKAQAGDESAYTELLNAVSILIRPHFIRKGLREDDLEDIIQELLIGIHYSRHTFNPAHSFMKWLYAIAHYKWADFLNKKEKNRSKLEHYLNECHVFLTQEDSTNYEDVSYQKELINTAIASLNAIDQTIIREVKLNGKRMKEVADQLNLSETNVKVRVHRALKKLEQEITKRYKNEL